MLCPFDQKKWIFRYFISENLPTFFLPWPSHTLHVQHNEGQTFIKSYLNIMLCNSTNIANLQNFIFLHRIIKKVTNSLSDPPRTAPVAFLGSSNFFIQRILNFTAHFLNTYCLLIGQKVNKPKGLFTSKNGSVIQNFVHEKCLPTVFLDETLKIWQAPKHLLINKKLKKDHLNTISQRFKHHCVTLACNIPK